MEQAWWSSGEDGGEVREEGARMDNGVLKNWDDEEDGGHEGLRGWSCLGDKCGLDIKMGAGVGGDMTGWFICWHVIK
jgi:hypothetical protein